MTFAGAGGLDLADGVRFALAAGGVLVRDGGNIEISGGVFNQSASLPGLNLWTVGNSTLTLSSALAGGNGQGSSRISLVKAGAGTLVIAPPTSEVIGLEGVGINSLSGQFVLNEGTVRFASGGKNTLQAGNQIALIEGTLDLNGGSQHFGALFSDQNYADANGEITSASAAGLIVGQDDVARDWSGSITEAVRFAKQGANTLSLYSAQTYTGSTLISGGSVRLTDAGALTATTGLTLSFGGLVLDNANGPKNNNDRLRNATAIDMVGGTIELRGRAQVNTSEIIGAVTLGAGANTFRVVSGGSGDHSAELIAASLTRELGATAYFDGPTGLAGNTARLTFGSLPDLENGILGGWAVTSTGDFATYVAGLGIRGLAASGYATTLSNASTSAQNIKLGVSASSLTGSVTINSLATSAVAAGNVSIANGSTLKIGSGGILSNATADWSIGTLADAGTITSGVSELFLYSGGAGSLTVRSVIADDGSNPVGLVKFGAGTVNLSGVNTYTGGTTINEGVLEVAVGSLIPKATADLSKGLVLNNAVFTQSFAGAVHQDNIVTLNGGASITYYGDNTQAALVFNNLGGSATPTVRTFNPNVAGGAIGTLTLTDTNAIEVSSANVGTTSLIEGRVDFGVGMKTVQVGAIDINGSTDVSPLQASLILQAVVGTADGIRKTGDGVLQFNAQSVFNGQVIVEAGGIKTGYTNAGSRFANLQLDAGTRFDLNGFSTTWGSLSGDGDVFSSSGTPTLTVGFDGTSTTFSGRLIRFNDAAYGQLTKVGVGTLTLDTAQDANGSFGAITVRGGSIRYEDDGQALVSSAAENTVFNLQSGGALEVNNSFSNVANRLGAAINGTVNLLGGTFVLGGNSAADSSETIANLNLTTGGSLIELTRSGSRLLDLTLTNLSAPSAGSLVIAGLAGSARLNVTNANLVAGQGSSGTAFAVRGDILVDSGLDIGFLANAGGTWRALATADLNSDLATWGSQQNALLSVATTIGASTSVNTLTIGSPVSLASSLPDAFGGYGTDGASVTLTMANASALLVKSDVVSIDVDVRGSSTQAPQFHVLDAATLDLNGRLGLGSTVGFVKAGNGTMNLNARTGFTGVVTVNGGTLNLFGGAENTFVVGESVGPARVSDLQLNGLLSVVNVNNRSQVIGALTSANTMSGSAGMIRNLGLDVVTLTSTGGGTFGGAISGNLNFVRSGNNSTSLTGVSDYTGETIIRGGSLTLVDSGALTNTSALHVRYGSFVWDNFGLNPLDASVPTRVDQTVPVSLLGGTFRVIGAGSVDTVVTLDEISLLWGSNVLETQPVTGSGGTVRVNIGDLVRTGGSQTTMLFAGRSTLGLADSNTLGQSSLSGSSLVFLSELNGFAYSENDMVNGIIGGWAVASGDSAAFATYSDTAGVAQMTSFTAGAISGVTIAAGNYNNDATARTITGAKEANSWRLSGAAHNVTFASGASLTLGAGLLTSGNAAYTLIASDASNTITGAASGAGGDGNLYFYAAQNTTSLQPQITGSSAVVSFGGGTLQLAPRFADNDYTGGTFVNAGTLNLNSRAKVSLGSASIQATTNTILMANTTGFTVDMVIVHPNFPAGTKITAVNANASLVVNANSTNNTALTAQTITSRDSWAALPTGGDLTVTNATVTMSNSQVGQVGEGTNVTIYGSGRLTFGNYASRVGADITHTLGSITFDHEGGTVNPELNLGTPTGTGFVSRFVLSSASAITSSNESLSTVPTISTGSNTLTSLQFSDASPVITVNAGAVAGVIGLNISAPIGQHSGMTGALRKTGSGVLALTNSESTFANGFNLNTGGLMIGASSDGPTPSKGPVGTGMLTIAGGTSLFADNAARTLHNEIVVNGDFTIGGNGGAALTLAGTIDLGASARTITFATAGITTTFDGAVNGTGLTKAGNGILQLGGVSSLTLGAAGLEVAGGVVKAGVSENLSASLLTVRMGAGYDLNGFDQTIDEIGGAGFITNSAALADSNLTVGSSNNFSFDGVLADGQSNLNFVKAGSGELTLKAQNLYRGTTLVNEGRLIVDDGASVGSGKITVNFGTFLEYRRTDSFNIVNEFEGAGTVEFMGINGLARITGDSTINSGLNVVVGDGSALQLGDNGTTGSLNGLATLELRGNAVLRFDRTDRNMPAFTAAISSQASGDGRIVQFGSGLTILSGGSNPFSGDVDVIDGELEAGAVGVLENARSIAIRDGATFTVSADGALGGAAGVLAPDVELYDGALFRMLAVSEFVLGAVNDLTLRGGVVDSGLTSASSAHSLYVKGAITVSEDSRISATNVAFIKGGIASAATDIDVALGKTLDFSGTIKDDSARQLASSFNKMGDGTLVLSGNNSGMSGASTVTAGNVDVRHQFALGDGAVNPDTTLTAGITIGLNASLSSNQSQFTVGGSGAVAGKITLETGASIGVSAPTTPQIGHLSLSGLTLKRGSIIDFKIWDSGQAAGIGYDKLDLGALDLTDLSPTNRVTIRLISMSSASVLGEAVDFAPESFGTFAFGTFTPTGGNINDLFSIDTSMFYNTGSQNVASDAGLWSIDFNAASGAITLTAVPEPSTYGFGLGALALAAAAIRRRKRVEKKA